VILHLVGTVNKKMVIAVEEFLRLAILKDKTVTIRITSGGGDPDMALAIVGLMRAYPGQVDTEIYGQCYSAAVLIFAAGSHRSMSKYAWCMVHEGSEEIEGNASSIKHCAKQMERDEAAWNAILEEFTGTDRKTWEKLTERDTYLNAEECRKLNLCTEIF
jgi:ATP-dependent protease ClpP protease subunit